MCRYCNNFEDWEEDKREWISKRELSKIDHRTYSGIDMQVNPKERTIEGICVLLEKYVKPLSKTFEIKINYCPICGRKLSEVSEND